MTAVLYILMRTDLASMNAGKAMAQASHASNAFVHQFNERCREQAANTADSDHSYLSKMFHQWQNSTHQGFGTVIVLGGKWNSEIIPAIERFAQTGGKYLCDVVHDPTYPLLDGEYLHLIPLNTCAYVFVPNREEDLFAKNVLGGMNLHA